MFWDEATRTWRRHPDCRCDHDPCYCRWLRPLVCGKPVPAPIQDAMRAAMKERLGVTGNVDE